MNKNMEMMKKLIEEKKNKGKNTKSNMKAQKTIGFVQAGRKKNNGGGLFDK
ncbi:hypothetical protein [Clostridium sp. LIBA-8841]|uniref:hypothetical protein n=1 Tax=Clostridium sp. LIBA-8841 TaxID=2987530 RepID=UPI002AC5AC4A|nr:hypothetical protein [Clostridium sp. LIBA-8841]MDZ5254491.1 hypothetical protein [Clostridium sp. LIBA-8841]